MSGLKLTDSKEKLIEAMQSGMEADRHQIEIAKAILDVKGQKEIADQTRKLTIATWILAFATIGLVVSTIALILVKK